MDYITLSLAKKYANNIVTDYATKDYVDQAIATFDFIKIVTELPETGLVNKTYFVPKINTETNDIYDEYMWIDNKWEFLGTKQIKIDLTDYVKNTDYPTSTKSGVIKVAYENGVSVNQSGYMTALPKTFEQYQSLGNGLFLSKGTLENVIEGKELVNKPYVDNNLSKVENKVIDTRNELERVKNDILETGKDTDTYIHLEDSAMAEYQELSVDGVCEQETTSIANGDEYDSPSPDHPQPISTIENSLSVTSNNGKDETAEDYLESVITANLPEGEFIGKIDNTYKDTLKVEYNEEDGNYHLNLYKNVGKVILDGSETNLYCSLETSGFRIKNILIPNKIFAGANHNNLLCNIVMKFNNDFNVPFILYVGQGEICWIQLNFDNTFLSTMTKNELLNAFKTYCQNNNVEIYYPIIPYTVDLGIVDMPITYNEITNLFTDSDLLPQINAKYYRNFISTVRNLQVNEKALKQELIYINTRLSALESAATSVTSESEVTE